MDSKETLYKTINDISNKQNDADYNKHLDLISEILFNATNELTVDAFEELLKGIEQIIKEYREE